MPNPFEQAAKEAAAATDEALASQITNLTHFTADEAHKLFPGKVDKQRLIELLAIVNAATAENEKVANLTNNINKYAGTVIKLIKSRI